MLKVVSVIIVFCCCTLAGFYFSYKLSRRQLFLKDFIAFLKTFETHIRYSSDDIFTLINISMTSASLLSIKEYILNNKGSFNDLWLGSMSQINKQTGLTAQDKALLEEFGASLGTTDGQGQINHIELYTTLFQKACDEAQQELKAKSKLYKMLGFFAGTAFALMVI